MSTLTAGGVASGAVAAGGVARRRLRRRLALAVVVLLAAFAFLLYKGLTSAVVYFKTASEAVAARAALGNSTFQIEGTVVPCTLRRIGPDAYDFSIASGAKSCPSRVKPGTQKKRVPGLTWRLS